MYAFRVNGITTDDVKNRAHMVLRVGPHGTMSGQVRVDNPGQAAWSIVLRGASRRCKCSPFEKPYYLCQFLDCDCHLELPLNYAASLLHDRN